MQYALKYELVNQVSAQSQDAPAASQDFMSAIPPKAGTRSNLVLSLVALMVGSLLLRAAAGAMGENIQFYFNAINEAAQSPNHPLRTLIGANVYAISYALGGLIIGSFFVAELLGSLVLGAWSDRHGRKRFIVLGPLFGAVAVLITALTTALWLLIFTRLLEGLSTAASVPATLAYITDATEDAPKLRARVVGFFQVATIGGVAVGFSLGGWLWRSFGAPAIVAGIPLTSPAFALNAVVYLVSLLILAWGVHEARGQIRAAQPASSVRETLAGYWRTVTSPEVANFAPAWIAINGVLGIWINLSARILTDKSGFAGQLLVGRFNSFQAGNLRATYAVFFVLGILGWSLIYAPMRKTTVMLIGIGGLFLSCLVLWALNHQPALDAPLVGPLAVLLVISILIQSGFTPAALAYLADIAEGHAANRGAIMGLYSVFLGLGQFLGASLGGPFVDWRGADGMVVATTLLGLIAGVLLFRLRGSDHTAGTAVPVLSEHPSEFGK
jgi:MFS family permease